MKSFQKVTFTVALTVIMLVALPCSGQNSKSPILQAKAPFKTGAINFQEWYAGINIGATGLNVFIPISTNSNDVVIDKLYFRNLIAKLEKKGGKYVAVLKNKHKTYTFKKSKRSHNFPFSIADNECVIGYFEKGVQKYYKVRHLNEIASVYYENGPPALQLQESNASMANLDSEEDDN